MNDDIHYLRDEIERLRQELRNRDDPQRRLMESEQVVHLLVDPQTTVILDASPRAVEYYGYSRKELLGKPLQDLGPCGTASGPNGAHRGADPAFATQHRLANGEVRDVRISSWPGWYARQRVLNLVVVDMTGQLKAMHETALHDRKFQDLFHASLDFIFIVEVDNGGLPLRLVDVNRVACERVGCSRDDFLHMTGKDFHRVVNREDFLGALPGWQQSGQATFESTIIARDGSVVPVEVKGSHLMFGKTKIALCIMRDLTERKQSEAALRRSEERYRLLLDYSPYGVMIYSGCIIEYANPRAAELLQSDVTSLVGMSLMRLAHLDSAGVFEESLQGLETVDAIAPIEANVERVDGSVMTIEAVGTAFWLEGRRVIQVVFRDISDRKHELIRAAAVQHRMRKDKSPLPAKMQTAAIYLPSQTISGDFFHLDRVDDDYVVGLIGDGSGNGVAAALNISALHVAFHESTLHCKEPITILQRLNRVVANHLEEDYVAACCFSIDFRQRKLTAVCAGIHHFYHLGSSSKCIQYSFLGSPLGMFRQSEFDQIVLDICPGDKFWFYTDGLDDELSNPELLAELTSRATLADQRKLIYDRLLRHAYDDDCTWLGIEIR